jgi:hypothetical protein
LAKEGCQQGKRQDGDQRCPYPFRAHRSPLASLDRD